MGKVTLVGECPKTDKVDELREWISSLSKDLVQQINGNITIFDNLKVNVLDVTFLFANTDTTIRHTLGKVPTGYWLVKTNVATQLYTGDLPATTTDLTLKATTSAITKVLVF